MNLSAGELHVARVSSECRRNRAHKKNSQCRHWLPPCFIATGLAVRALSRFRQLSRNMRERFIDLVDQDQAKVALVQLAHCRIDGLELAPYLLDVAGAARPFQPFT